MRRLGKRSRDVSDPTAASGLTAGAPAFSGMPVRAWKFPNRASSKSFPGVRRAPLRCRSGQNSLIGRGHVRPSGAPIRVHEGLRAFGGVHHPYGRISVLRRPRGDCDRRWLLAQLVEQRPSLSDLSGNPSRRFNATHKTDKVDRISIDATAAWRRVHTYCSRTSSPARA